MQPVPLERSTNKASLTTETSSAAQSPAQHGILESHHLVGREHGAPVSPPASASESDALSVSSGSSSRERLADFRRMSSPDGSPHGLTNLNRIDEYERSSTANSPRPESRLFQVIPSKSNAVPRLSIEEFPNEVLTHLLSHLPPSSLSAISLVSKRFHNLITTPHAWRTAFSRYFPGPESIFLAADDNRDSRDEQQISKSSRRAFSRLSALATWRSEYILRTRLLRSLGRGKPAQFQSISRAGHAKHTSNIQASAVSTYGSGLLYPVSHIHATFGTGLNKRQPLFIHGASEQGLATTSDPASGKIDHWGVNDHQAFRHFADMYVGDAEYGLGTGEMVGMPNVMDLSQSYGKIYGEACPSGMAFFTPTTEQRGRYLANQSPPNHDLGIPEVVLRRSSITSVWIAKTDTILKLTGGQFGMLVGSSKGILSAYSLGTNPAYNQRFIEGEPTAKWALSPGVPLIAICVDEHYSLKRHAQNRIWAVVLNALGEIYYLTELPKPPETIARPYKYSFNDLDRWAWEIGRSVEWALVQATRRTSRPDPFNTSPVDGSYSPRSSPSSLGLSKEQANAEAKEIEIFLKHPPKHFQKVCEGWNMRRKMHIDFAGYDGSGGGESIVVIDCGLGDGCSASIRRYTHRKFKVSRDVASDPFPAIQPSKRPSLFGGPLPESSEAVGTPSSVSTPRSRTSSQDTTSELYDTEWLISDFAFGGLRGCQVSATAFDESMFATLLAGEDPLLGMNGSSTASSPLLSPIGKVQTASSIADIPGQRGRFLAAGLMTGNVIVWDIRGSIPSASDIINTVAPVRIICTDSPQISSLALTSLYLVHGGSDGLVQAWDPLASTLQPIRTLHSRFSSRARRRLIQAGTSSQGIGHNYYAAGAIVLDPDPTSLRGMVGLGTHLRYWSYSSSSADQYKSGKRRLRRRSERGSNAAHNDQRFNHSGRGALKDYIAHERFEMEREKNARHKEEQLLRGRFGTDLLGPGASEEELLAYATMLSEESFSANEVKRSGSSETSSALSSISGETLPAQDISTPLFEISPSGPSPTTEPQESSTDPEIAEAIRLSLLDQQTPANSTADTSYLDTSSSARDTDTVPIRYGKKQRPRRSKAPSSSSQQSSTNSPFNLHEATSSTRIEEDDLEFALRLSLAEEQSKAEQRQFRDDEEEVSGSGDIHAPEDDYPELERNITARRDGDGDGRSHSPKGKGKATW